MKNVFRVNLFDMFFLCIIIYMYLHYLSEVKKVAKIKRKHYMRRCV